MKILMLTPYLPFPPHSGGQTRSYNLIKFLGKSHQITLFSLIKNEQERKYQKVLEKYCQKVKLFARPVRPWTIRNILKTGFGPYPFLVVRNYSEELKKSVARQLATAKFDLVHAENFYVMPYLPKTSIPVVLVEQTIFYRSFLYFVESLPWWLFWLKPILMTDILKLKHWESYFWKRADYLVAVSQEDKDHIQKLAPEKEIYLVPNGVDVDFFSQRKFIKSPFPTIFFGNADFHWIENTEGAKLLFKSIWPQVKAGVKRVRLLIGGKTAPQVLKEYSSLKRVMIKEIGDSREGYQHSWIEVAPLRSGGGSRTKLFEAMASGLPVLTTPEGAEGIIAGEKFGVIVDKNLASLAKKAVRLLNNKKEAERLGFLAQKTAREYYGWEQSAQKLAAVYEKVSKDGKS